MPRWTLLAATLCLTGSAILLWQRSQPGPAAHPAPAPVEVTSVQTDVVPAGIVVTESSPAVPPPGDQRAPGDRLLGDYADPAHPPANDLTLLGRAISSFLLIDKQAADRPLSANEEWSAALRGKRPGTEPWLSDPSPLFDSRKRLIDRWQTPLIFHALGGKQWEIRSAGPDRKPWTSDDLIEKTAG